jgi:hypothetical protein
VTGLVPSDFVVVVVATCPTTAVCGSTAIVGVAFSFGVAIGACATDVVTAVSPLVFVSDVSAGGIVALAAVIMGRSIRRRR